MIERTHCPPDCECRTATEAYARGYEHGAKDWKPRAATPEPQVAPNIQETPMDNDTLTQPALKVWTCKIGGYVDDLPPGADSPLRRAVSEAYQRLTGREDEFCFSGWGGSLNAGEMEVAYPNREPQPAPPSSEHPIVRRHPDGGYYWTECRECETVNGKIDEDGCCWTCGAEAVRYGAEDEPAPPAAAPGLVEDTGREGT